MSKFMNSLPERIVATTICSGELGDLFTLVHHVRSVCNKMYMGHNDVEQVFKALLQMGNKDKVGTEEFNMLNEYFPWAQKVFSEAFYREFLAPDEARTDAQKIKMFNIACREGNAGFFDILPQINIILKELLDE